MTHSFPISESPSRQENSPCTGAPKISTSDFCVNTTHMGQSDVSQIGSMFSQDLRVLKGGAGVVATGVEVIINMVLAGLDGVVIGTVIIWVINKVM